MTDMRHDLGEFLLFSFFFVSISKNIKSYVYMIISKCYLYTKYKLIMIQVVY